MKIIFEKMNVRFRWVLYACAGVLVALSAASVARGQGQATIRETDDSIKYARGQNVVPAYEGWVRNPDGTFGLVFGYWNRNWEEEMYIPIGPNNHVDPGGPDRGQPTYFGPRRGKNLFEITVPKDFGNKEVIWTLVSRGKTEKAYGALVPQEVLTRRMVQLGGSLSAAADAGDDNVGAATSTNKPPSVTIDPVPPIRLPSTATLSATVSDDGLPKPVAGGRGGGRGGARGLRVNWTQHGGPVKVTFAPTNGPLENSTGGKVTTTATFPTPGTYVLRANVTDGEGLEAWANVTVTVNP